MTQVRRVGPGAWIALGFVVTQVFWMLTVPPFRAMDEWDHAYRAAAVAEGQWLAEPGDATRGTGALVRVPRDIVSAAHEECARLPYTGPGECVGADDGVMTEVASGAGRYHPFFYAVIGYPTLPFDGVHRLWAMRVVAAGLCAGLFALALGSISRWRLRGRAVWATVVVAVTPTVAYTSIVAAPNGVEIMSGLAWWTALVGLGLARDPRSDRYFLVTAALSGALLVTVRSLGPLWCLLALATCLLAFRPPVRRIVEIVRRPRGVAAVSVVVLAAGLSVLWSASQGSLEVGDGDGTRYDLAGALAESASKMPAWLLQTIGAFPYRDQPAPIIVYVTWLLVGAALVVPALRRATGRIRLAMVLVGVLSVVIPFLVTVATINQYGTAWQGRYVLPYAVGLLLLAGLAWVQAGRELGPRLWAPGIVLLVVGAVAGPLAVLADEQAHSPWAGSASWPAPSPLLLGAGVIAGLLLMCGGVLREGLVADDGN